MPSEFDDGDIQLAAARVHEVRTTRREADNVADLQELALALRRGEERALTELYDRYAGAVYHLALRITRDTGAAEEISLDAFLQVWRQAERFDADQGTLQTWLFTIVRSRAIDRVRAAGAAKRTEPDHHESRAEVTRPDEMAELSERRRLVREAMRGLSPPQRAALELAYYEGLSHSQIATRLGEPLGTVKTRIRQAMKVVRDMLSPVLSTR
jgi:RNA polymerase sigma-70 factor (ECF subfamily)